MKHRFLGKVLGQDPVAGTTGQEAHNVGPQLRDGVAVECRVSIAGWVVGFGSHRIN